MQVDRRTNTLIAIFDTVTTILISSEASSLLGQLTGGGLVTEHCRDMSKAASQARKALVHSVDYRSMSVFIAAAAAAATGLGWMMMDPEWLTDGNDASQRATL